MFNFNAFVDGYICAHLWCDAWPAHTNPAHPDHDPENWESGGMEHLAYTVETRNAVIERAQLHDFVDHAMADLLLYCEKMGPWHGTDSRGYCEDPPEARAGHDFYLTRAGHGAGFWDRGLGTLGDRLTEASKSYGSPDDHILIDNGDGTAVLL